jgi:citrate lyase beta subunit
VSADISVRITRAAPEADLEAAVWPGLSTVYYPRAESPAEIQVVAARIDALERLRGVRPGTIGVVALVESPRGVSMARAIAHSSDRMRGFGVGPNLNLVLDGDALFYSRGECELHARVLDLDSLACGSALD